MFVILLQDGTVGTFGMPDGSLGSLMKALRIVEHYGVHDFRAVKWMGS